MKQNLVITDADNTLWDTNAVFTDAQIGLLAVLRAEGYRLGGNEFQKLRELDSLLVELTGMHEYDFRLLALAVILHSRGMTVKGATRTAVRDFGRRLESYKTTVENGVNEFRRRLTEFPPLYANVRSTLRALREKYGCVLALVSNGNEARVNETVDHYKIRRYFDIISTGKKNLETYVKVEHSAKALMRGVPERVVVIGDQIDVDIVLGNKIGAITVFKPGGYRPEISAANPDEVPDYVVDNFSGVLDVFKVTRARPVLEAKEAYS